MITAICEKGVREYFDNLNPQFIGWNFYQQYLDKEPPFGTIGLTVFLRTYSHYLSEFKRREYWHEVVLRCVEFSLRLETKSLYTEQVKEAEALFDVWFNLKGFPAGRSLWVGHPNKNLGVANFNCCFTTIEKISDYTDICHLLMVGAGVGFSVESKYVSKLPDFYPNKQVTHLPYDYLPKGLHPSNKGLTFVTLQVSDKTTSYCNLDDSIPYELANTVSIIVGDSREGWEKALEVYLTAFSFSNLKKINVEYSSIRPKGYRLKTMGGRASGHEPYKQLLKKIHWIIAEVKNNRLSTVQASDIVTCIAEAIVVGGVRRSATLSICDQDDLEFQKMKLNMWEDLSLTSLELNHTAKTLDLWDRSKYQTDFNYRDAVDAIDKHNPNYRWRTSRVLANNSIMLEDFDKDQVTGIFESILKGNDLGFINKKGALKRRSDFQGVNPCVEILLRNKGVCNLVEANVKAFIEGDNFQWYEFIKTLKLITRHNLRVTEITFWDKEWDKTQKEDRLLGVSLTGLVEAFNHLEWTEDQIASFYFTARQIVHQEVETYSFFLEIPKPLLATTEKPSGSLSSLPTVSSGIHAPFAPYFIRRIRVSAVDPVAKALLDLKIPVCPENGFHDLESSPIWVFSFYVKSDAKHNSNSESALTQLTRYESAMKNYVDHNVSITVTFRKHEIPEIVNWIETNIEKFVGIAFLPVYDAGAYPNLPYEAITEKQYLELSSHQVQLTEKQLNKMISQYEIEEEEYSLEEECSSGVCPIR